MTAPQLLRWYIFSEISTADAPPCSPAPLRPRGHGGEKDILKSQAHGNIETASHATGVLRHFPCACIGQREPSQERVRNGSWVLQVPQLATSTRFSRPVRISSTAVNCPVRLMDFPTVPGLVDAGAHDGGNTGVGLQQRGEHVDKGCLAHVFKAEQNENAAFLTAKSTPRRTSTDLYGLKKARNCDG